MELNLKKPLAFFDLETTGVDVTKDRIVEIAILKIHPNQKQETLYFKINPGVPIPIQASQVHGIYDKDVINCPKFAEVALEILNFLKNCDLGGFNSNKFDIPMLKEEMLRVQYDLDIESRNLVDVQIIYHKMEPRTLEAAYKYYCKKDLNNAHSAEADTMATYEVLKAQLDKYPELQNDVEYLSNTFNNASNYLDSSRRFLKTEKGIILCFGKYKDHTIEEVIQKDKNYFNWMYQADFALDTKNVILKLSEQFQFKINK